MTKWLAKAKAADTRMALIIYYLFALLNVYFVMFLFPPKGVKTAVQQTLTNSDSTGLHIFTGATAVIGGVVTLVVGLFITVYLEFILYYIVLTITKTQANPATNKLIKRGLYISYGISGVVGAIITMGTVLLKVPLTSTPYFVVSGFFDTVVTYGLIYGFIKYLAKQPKQATWFATIGVVLNIGYLIVQAII
ncbi:MAG: hypothetical protein LKF36_09410 [Lactobacillus sp.]|jgi:hypothetical protein|nr:hypothetical protein [Lactobacillus sp.]